MKLLPVSAGHTSESHFHHSPGSIFTSDITSKTKWDRRLNLLHKQANELTDTDSLQITQC